MTKWNNFNDAEDQMSYELIPNKTIAKVRLLIKKGNHITDEFTDGYATLSKAGTSIYLACEFVVLSGEYEHRKVWSNIGLCNMNSRLGTGGDRYADIGRSMIKAILDSAHGLHPADKSPKAEKLRIIKSFADLDNLICVAEITIDDRDNKPRNEIKTIITPDHAKYSEHIKKQTDDNFLSDEVPFE